jgi:UTP:GlnB (protein PII) uridylyltransferase
VIEVQAGDKMGLGFRLASVIANLGLNILSAKLATEKGYAFDVFYIQTKEGEKITSSFQMTEILERLHLRYPGVELRYAWPFDLSLVADLLHEQVARFS